MSPANKAKPSILLIEDDPAIRDFLRSALTSAGYNLEEAWTGSRRSGSGRSAVRRIW